MLMTSQTKKIEIYDVTISSLDGMHEIKVKLNKVDRSELLTTSNPNYEKIIREYKHLISVKMDEYDTKSDLPIHLILGIGEYARIRTRTKPLVGKEGEPIAEQTKFGWVIMSPGVEFDQSTMLLTTTSQADFERLCRLGLEDTSEKHRRPVYDEFKETLTRSEEGWYETSLPWKSNHPKLPTNGQGSQRRLGNLLKWLERKGIYEEYNSIIQDQLEKGIVKPAPLIATEKKLKTSEIFQDATFKLHKWHSNEAELESMSQDEQANKTDVPTFAKEQFGTHGAESKLLGMSWNREKDTLSVVLDKERRAATTKRGALSNLASVYDPLGLVSPTTLQGKLIYRGMCEERLGWDQEFHEPLRKRWAEWYERLPDHYTVPRALTPYQDSVQAMCLHGFGDACKDGVSAVVYAVTKQESGPRKVSCARSLGLRRRTYQFHGWNS